jgi:signal transduction histidine kinase
VNNSPRIKNVVPSKLEDIPASSILSIVNQLMLQNKAAVLRIDEKHVLQQVYGSILHFFPDGLKIDATIISDLYILEGILPLEEEKHVIESVQLESGIISNIHLIANDNSTWVIFIDVSNYAFAIQGEREKFHRLALEKEQQAKTIEQLKHTNDSLLDFALMIGHDLKAPLNGLKLICQMIVEDYADSLDDEARKLFGMLEERADRMSTLVSAVIKYAAAGPEIDEKDNIEFADCVNQIVSRLCDADSATITIINEVPFFLCQKSYFDQILYNILVNAVTHSDKVLAKVIVKSTQSAGEVVITVKDNGPGMEESQRKEIFKLFYKTNLDATKYTSGMDLAIAKKLALKMGGDMWVESTSGEGTEIAFSIPQEPPA